MFGKVAKGFLQGDHLNFYCYALLYAENQHARLSSSFFKIHMALYRCSEEDFADTEMTVCRSSRQCRLSCSRGREAAGEIG